MLVYCGQMVGWIKMKLDMVIDADVSATFFYVTMSHDKVKHMAR